MYYPPEKTRNGFVKRFHEPQGRFQAQPHLSTEGLTEILNIGKDNLKLAYALKENFDELKVTKEPF